MKTLNVYPPTPFANGQKRSHTRLAFIIILCAVIDLFSIGVGNAAQIYAGVAKADITDYAAGPVNDPLATGTSNVSKACPPDS